MVEVAATQQRRLLHLGLEVDGEAAEAGDAIGEIDRQNYRLNRTYRSNTPLINQDKLEC